MRDGTQKMENVPQFAPAAASDFCMNTLLGNSCFHLWHCVVQISTLCVNKGLGSGKPVFSSTGSDFKLSWHSKFPSAANKLYKAVLTGAAVDDVGEFDVLEAEAGRRPDDVLVRRVLRVDRHASVPRERLNNAPKTPSDQTNYKFCRSQNAENSDASRSKICCFPHEAKGRKPENCEILLSEASVFSMMWPAESGLFLPSNIINYLSIDVDQGKK